MALLPINDRSMRPRQPAVRPRRRRALPFRAVCVLLWLAVALSSRGATLQENFSTDPLARGWTTVGDGSLFRWNPTAQNLDVTWDSSRGNSFFLLPLGTVLTLSDDFSFSFAFRLQDIRVGSTPGKSNEFEIAIGLVNATTATNANAYRGAGVSSTYGVRNLVELDYFPDAGFGDTLATTVVSTNNRIFPVHNFPVTLSPGDTFRITLAYTAADQVLRTAATRNGSAFGLPPDQTLGVLELGGKPDFRVDSFAIISYSDAIQTGPPSVHGSVLAHGTVDDVQLNLPAPPVTALRLRFIQSLWNAEFVSRTQWVYQLERTTDLLVWTPTSRVLGGTGAVLTLTDTNLSAANIFYRVRAERP